MLRDFQQTAHEKAMMVLRAGEKRGYSAPTGSGKSYVMAANHDAMRTATGFDMLTVVPTTEIGLGVYDKTVAYTSTTRPPIREWSEERQQRLMESGGVWTVMRLYNALMSEELTDLPKYLQFDEGHHTTANTYEAVHAICGDCPAVMYTATGFRGTPDETAKLEAKWGKIEPVLTLQAAVERGYVARPDFRVWPLVNDETIKVTNGEFETKAVETDLKKVVPALVKRIREEFCYAPMQVAGGKRWYTPRRPTMVTAPGVSSAKDIADTLGMAGIFAVLVTGSNCYMVSGRDEKITHLSRQKAFEHVVKSEAILVQVNVVSEGVDLPIRVQIDTAPCMSPVRWQQRVGRGTRPILEGEERPVYICTNHNLTRHAYLWAGVIPSAQIRDAQTAWGPDFKPSRRMFARALGLEGFGRFAVAQVPLIDGTFCALYALQTPNGTHQYAALMHPTREAPVFFERSNPHTGEIAEKRLDNGNVVVYKVKDYGPWKIVKTIPNLDGYVSTKPGNVTPKMLARWQKPAPQWGAERCGLDPEFLPNAREFQILFMMLDTNLRFQREEE